MCQAESVSLDAEAQRMLARWAAKTAVCLILSEPGTDDVIPESQRFWLRQNDTPHDAMWVGLCAYKGLAQKDAWTGLDPDGADTAEGQRWFYNAFLSFGSVAFKVFGVEARLAQDRWRDVRGMQPFWPPQPSVLSWPPAQGITGSMIKTAIGDVPLVGYGPAV